MIPRALSAAAFTGRDPGARVERFSGQTMGTSWSLSAVSPPSGTAQGVQAALNRVVSQMSQWEPASDISRFNRAPPGGWRMLPPEFTRVLKAGLEVAEASRGAFNPAMGALTDLWGFGPLAAPTAIPGDEAIAAALPGNHAIELDAPGLRARRTAAGQLDFSGIAKGFGVDLAAEWLLSQGVRHFLIEVGGELRGEGIKPDGQPWWAEIEQPRGVALPPLTAALHGLSIATSGDYRRWLDADGQRFAHTIDPRSGRPIGNGVRSVTVLHPSCMLADAWATALTVLGPEGIPVADQHDLAVHMIAGTRELMSSALMRMLD